MALVYQSAGTSVAASGGAPVIATTTSFAVGDVLVVAMAYDNSGGGGADPIGAPVITTTPILGSLLSTQSGHNDPGAASAGLATKVVAYAIANALSSGTNVNISWTGTVVVRAIVLVKVSSNSGGAVAYRTSSGATGTNYVASAAPALTTPSVNNGELVLCWAGHEYGAAITGDADTTNGTWSSIIAAFTGSTTSGMSMGVQGKVVTATATQAFNPTGTTSDWIAGALIFSETLPPIPLVVQDAAHGHTADNVTIQHIIPEPPIPLVVQDAAHAHFTQQPREDYFTPTLGTLSTPDWGAMPATFCFLTKTRGGPVQFLNYSMASQAPGPPQESWAIGRASTGLYINYSGDGSSSMGVSTGVGVAPMPHPYRTEYFAYVYAGTSPTNGLQQWRSTGEGGAWTLQYNAGAAGVTFFDSTGPVKIGIHSANYPGDIYWIEMRSGSDPNGGTVLWRYDAAEHVSGTSWVDARGKTWTLSTAAAITHIPATSDITIVHFPPTQLVVQNCQHNFVNQTEVVPYLNPLTSRAMTPDPGTFIGDDFVIVARAKGPVVSTGSLCFVSQNPASPDQSWRVNRIGLSGTSGQGALQAAFYPTGTITSSFNSPSSSTNNGITIDAANSQLLAYAYNKATGAWRSMLSTDGGVTWPVARSGTSNTQAAFFDSTGPVWIGADGPGGISSTWDGTISWVEARSGIDPLAGTLLWRFDASEHVSGLNWVDARGRTWSVTNATGIVRPVTNTPIIEHVVPAVVTPDDCFHSHVSQQPAEHYITQLSADSCSTPDFGAMPATFTITAKVRGGPNGSTGVSGIASQFGSGDSSWSFGRTGTSGGVGLTWSSSGANSIQTTAGTLHPHPYRDDYIGVAYYGTGINDQKFIQSTDYGATWPIISQGGSAITLRESAVAVIIGDTPGQTTFQGQIFWVEMRSGTDPLGGTLLWRFDAKDHVSGTTWTGAADGRTWTISSAGLITHVPAASNVTITEIPATNFVVQNAQHVFPNQIDMSPWLQPPLGVATTPDLGPLPTDGFALVMKTRGPQSTTSTQQVFLSQNRGDPNRSYAWKRSGQYISQSSAFPLGTQASIVTITGQGTPDQDRVNGDYWGITYVTTTGVSRLMRSTDQGATYTQSATLTVTPTGFFDSSDVVTVGADGTGATSIWDDRIYWIELRTGTDPKAGTLLWRFDASEWISGTSWTDARGKVWTLTSAAAVVRPGPTEPTIEVVVAPTLANADSYLGITSDTPAFTQTHVLVVDNAAHAVTSDSPPLTQVHVLAAVTNAAHTQVSDSPGITQLHVLTVAGAAHAQAVEHVAINVATNVPAADAAHAILSDSLTLTQVHVLTVQNATHAHIADAPPITQVHILTVASAAQAHVASNVDITQLHFLAAPANGAHAHVADNVAITQVHSLVVASAVHAHTCPEVSISTEGVVAGADGYHPVTSDNIALTQVHNLAVQSAAHAHTAANVTIVYSVNLPAVASALHAQSADVVTLIIDIPIASALHAHTADNVAPLAVIHHLAVDSAAHAHAANTVAITQIHVLVVDVAVQGHSASNVAITQLHLLTAASALHAHNVEHVPLEQTHILALASAFHAHSVGHLTLTQEHNLGVYSAIHDHFVDELLIEQIVWLIADAAYHAMEGEEVNLAGIIVLNKALAVYLGGTPVQRVYAGSAQVWP